MWPRSMGCHSLIITQNSGPGFCYGLSVVHIPLGYQVTPFEALYSRSHSFKAADDELPGCWNLTWRFLSLGWRDTLWSRLKGLVWCRRVVYLFTLVLLYFASPYQLQVGGLFIMSSIFWSILGGDFEPLIIFNSAIIYRSMRDAIAHTMNAVWWRFWCTGKVCPRRMPLERQLRSSHLMPRGRMPL